MSIAAHKINSEIQEFVMNHFPLARQRALHDDDLLLENNVVDSMGILDLVLFVEEKFGIRVETEELLPANFQSIASLSNFVSSKLNHR